MSVILEQDQEMQARFLEHQRKYPSMPNGFWPDELIVTGTFGEARLRFAITRKEFEDNLILSEFPHRLYALRMALWQAVKFEKEEPK